MLFVYREYDQVYTNDSDLYTRGALIPKFRDRVSSIGGSIPGDWISASLLLSTGIYALGFCGSLESLYS